MDNQWLSDAYENTDLCQVCEMDLEDLESWDGICYDCLEKMYDPIMALAYIETYDRVAEFLENYGYEHNYISQSWFAFKMAIIQMTGFNLNTKELADLKDYILDTDFLHWAMYMLGQLNNGEVEKGELA